jgi:hypothetical protein
MPIIVPEGNQEQEEVGTGEPLKYQATDKDEEEFFLMCHMGIQPSEAKALDEDYRKWLIARFIAQKQMEREMIQQQRMMQAIGPNIRVPT